MIGRWIFLVMAMAGVAAVAKAETLKVSVPQSSINLKSEPNPPPSQRQIEVLASTWAPNHLTTEAYLNDASDFAATSLPQLSANLLSTGWQTTRLRLLPVWGLSFTQLQREGSLQFSGEKKRVSETMNLLSFRIGLMATTPRPLWNYFEPYFGVALLPTYAATPSSAFSSGTTRTLNAMEATAGMAVTLRELNELVGVEHMVLEMGGVATWGVLTTSYTGMGLVAGARVNL